MSSHNPSKTKSGPLKYDGIRDCAYQHGLENRIFNPREDVDGVRVLHPLLTRGGLLDPISVNELSFFQYIYI